MPDAASSDMPFLLLAQPKRKDPQAMARWRAPREVCINAASPNASRFKSRKHLALRPSTAKRSRDTFKLQRQLPRVGRQFPPRFGTATAPGCTACTTITRGVFNAQANAGCLNLAIALRGSCIGTAEPTPTTQPESPLAAAVDSSEGQMLGKVTDTVRSGGNRPVRAEMMPSRPRPQHHSIERRFQTSRSHRITRPRRVKRGYRQRRKPSHKPPKIARQKECSMKLTSRTEPKR